MINEPEIDIDLHNTVHDCYLDSTGKKPVELEIAELLGILPENIRFLALRWGGSDTEVREGIYAWIERMKNNGEANL